VTTFEYNERLNPVRVTDALGNAAVMEWSTENLRTRLVDRENNTWRWEYDGNGNLCRETLPTGGTTEFFYDEFAGSYSCSASIIPFANIDELGSGRVALSVPEQAVGACVPRPYHDDCEHDCDGLLRESSSRRCRVGHRELWGRHHRRGRAVGYGTPCPGPGSRTSGTASWLGSPSRTK
jgi:YD repeat-containing protein